MLSDSIDQDLTNSNIESTTIIESKSDYEVERKRLNLVKASDNYILNDSSDNNFTKEDCLNNGNSYSNDEIQHTDLILNDFSMIQNDTNLEATNKPENFTDTSLISSVTQNTHCFEKNSTLSNSNNICDSSMSDSTKEDESSDSLSLSMNSDDSSVSNYHRLSRKRTLSDHSSQFNSSTESNSSNSSAISDISSMFIPWHQLKHLSLREIGVSPVFKGNKCVLGKFLPFKQAKSSRNFEFGAYASSNLIKRMKLFHSANVHTGCVNSLNFNQAGTLLASGSDDLNIVIYDWIKRKNHLKFASDHSSNVFQTKFVPHTGDCHLVTSSRDGQIRLAQLSQTGSCKSTIKLAQHRGAAHKLSMQYDSPYTFYSCGEDGVIHEIDLRIEKPVISLTAKISDKKVALYSIHTNPIKSFEFCVAGMNQHVLVYDTRKLNGDNKDCILRMCCPSNLLTSKKVHITSALYNHDSTEILASYSDDDIYLFNNESNASKLFNNESNASKPIGHKLQYTGHCNQATVKGVSFFGLQSEYVISGSDCGHIFVWDRHSSSIVNFFEGDKKGVINVLETHPTIPMLVTSGFDSDVKYWLPIDSSITSLKGLNKLLKKNKEERSDNSILYGPNDFMYLLLQSFRREQLNQQNNSSDSDDSDNIEDFINNIYNDDNNDDNDDDDADDTTESIPRRPLNNIQCPTQ